jgi:two-component system CheB/CheR fusion protein
MKTILGRPVERFLADPEITADLLQRLAKKETVHNCHLRLRGKNRSLKHVLVDANGLWKNDRLIHTRWFLRDITRRVELEHEILAISEKERRRFGQDLHDDLCQQLAGIEFYSQILANDLAAQFKKEAAQAAEIGKMVRHAISHSRDMAHGLSPLILDAEGLMPSLRELAASTKRIFRRDCGFRCHPPVEVADQNIGIHLYRIAQEAVSNAVKHGKAKRIEIRLAAAGNDVILTVSDNGSGIPKRLPKSKGMGLRIMHYRASVIRGSLLVHPNPNGGTAVICTVRNGLLPPAKGR